MSASTCILVLAATIAAGGAGLAAAALVALITQAANLRYLAYTAALGLALVPLVSGTPIDGALGGLPADLTAVEPKAVLQWAASAPVHGWLWALSQVAPSLLAVYVVGAAACLLRLGLRSAALGRVLRAAQVVDPAQFGGERSLPVRVSDDVRSALLIGVHRPTAVLPSPTLAQMDAEQLGLVLAHEEAHARRRDNLRLLAEEALRAALWFNPFVAWAAGQAAEAREQLCDEAVLRGADARQRRVYAETLLLAFRLGSEPEVTSTLINPGRRKLVVRFNTILNPVRPTRTKTAASIGLVAAAGLLACAVGAAAWAQAPQTFLKPSSDAPVDITADREMASGCETVWSGNVSIQSGDRNLKADLLRIVAAGKPNACGRLLTGEAYGNVVVKEQRQVEHGQVAHLDFTTGGIALN